MAFKTKALRYHGAISGSGVVKQNRETIAPAKFDLVVYYRGSVASQVVAKSGRAKYSNVCDVAHVDVTVQSLIATGDWR